MTRRAAISLATLFASLALGACGGATAKNANDKPSDKAKRFIKAGASPDCAKTATPGQKKALIKATATLTDEQLASICPDLFPTGFVTAREISKLRRGLAIDKSDGKGAKR